MVNTTRHGVTSTPGRVMVKERQIVTATGISCNLKAGDQLPNSVTVTVLYKKPSDEVSAGDLPLLPP